ncbi:MAG: hypothetical protein CL797_02225 [Chromatiales bacterium]|jgi:hypothetical protein|nr:hypothetical protein [Chromatiales bacterium]
MDKNTFDFIKEKYGLISSWAVWVEAGDNPTSNVGDLSIFNDPEVIKSLNENIVFVGLNISRSIKTPLANFHDSYSKATDFKIRFALKDSPFWGGYMTDIIKNNIEIDSSKIPNYLKNNPSIEKDNMKIFKEELRDLGCDNPLIISVGALTHIILKRNFDETYNIINIPHYAVRISKEKYREKILAILNK